MRVDQLPAPTVPPWEREPADVLPADDYKPGGEVWVWPHSTAGWVPGVVLGAGPLAVMARYQLTSHLGEVTDTMMPDRVARRVAGDRQVD